MIFLKNRRNGIRGTSGVWGVRINIIPLFQEMPIKNLSSQMLWKIILVIHTRIWSHFLLKKKRLVWRIKRNYLNDERWSQIIKWFVTRESWCYFLRFMSHDVELLDVIWHITAILCQKLKELSSEKILRDKLPCAMAGIVSFCFSIKKCF